eukprot:m.331166 g.331166  ORF g.331166 m.331166 type:complete len:526 (-) comp20472_c1_seq3:115-1692(-)
MANLNQPEEQFNRRMSTVRREKKGEPIGISLRKKAGDEGASLFVVANVVANSVADSAGIQIGDSIIAVNGQNVQQKTQREVLEMLRDGGVEMDLELERNGKTQMLATGIRARSTSPDGGTSQNAALGVAIVTGGAFGARSGVVRVDPGSPGARAGLQVGDIIKSVNGASVEGMSHPEVIQLLRESAENIAIDVMRGNEPVSAKTTSAMVLELGVVVERKDNGAIQVLECFVGGAADKIGIAVGDVLLEVNGESLHAPPKKKLAFAKCVEALRSPVENMSLAVASKYRKIRDVTSAEAIHKHQLQRQQHQQALQQQQILQQKQIQQQRPSIAKPPIRTNRSHYTISVVKNSLPENRMEMLGIAFNTVLAADTGKIIEHTVTGITANGAADRAGVRVDDGLVSINGMPLGDLDHDTVLRNLKRTGLIFSLGLTRDNALPPPPSVVVVQGGFSFHVSRTVLHHSHKGSHSISHCIWLALLLCTAQTLVVRRPSVMSSDVAPSVGMTCLVCRACCSTAKCLPERRGCRV